MRSYWYQKFEYQTIHVTVATDAKFWGLKFQNGFTHAKLRRRDPIFRHCLIIRTCSFTWAGPNKLSKTLLISGFISIECHNQKSCPKNWLKGTKKFSRSILIPINSLQWTDLEGSCTRIMEANIKHNRRRTIARLP